MKKALLPLFLIITLFVQLNPASCAGEWLVAPPEVTSESAAILKAIDAVGEPVSDSAHDHETGEDNCQCPCHWNFQPPLSCSSAVPAFISIPYAERLNHSFPDFPRDIYRPPHQL